MGLPPTSDLTPLNERGEPISAPIEWTPGLVQIPLDPRFHSTVSVERNGERLEVIAKIVSGHPQLAAVWPRSPAGTYEVDAQTAGRGWSASARWFVEPQKLTMPAVEAMLDELQRLPASVAVGLQRGGALAGMDLISPQEATLAEELDRLRRAVQGAGQRPGLAAVLRITAENPYAVLRSLEVWTPTERARRVHPTALRRAFQHAGNVDPAHRPVRVPEARAEHSVDVYENRLLRAFHEQVDARLRAVIYHASQAPTVKEAEALLSDLAHARRAATFIDDVGPLTEPPTRLTMVLLKRAEYRAALEAFLDFRRSAIVYLHDAAQTAPFENIPSLYETWGTLEVIDALISVAVDEEGFVVKRQNLVSAQPGRTWVTILSGGTAVELKHPLSGRIIRLKPQRSYPKAPTGLRSVSFLQKPDVAIEVVEPDGQITVLIYDPKYKLQSDEADDDGSTGGTPKKQDIDKMHSYRDSIRDGNGHHIVTLAAILYPGVTVVYEPGLAALQAQPADPQPLRGTLRASLRDAMAARPTFSPIRSPPGGV